MLVTRICAASLASLHGNLARNWVTAFDGEIQWPRRRPRVTVACHCCQARAYRDYTMAAWLGLGLVIIVGQSVPVTVGGSSESCTGTASGMLPPITYQQCYITCTQPEAPMLYNHLKFWIACCTTTRSHGMRQYIKAITSWALLPAAARAVPLNILAGTPAGIDSESLARGDFVRACLRAFTLCNSKTLFKQNLSLANRIIGYFKGPWSD